MAKEKPQPIYYTPRQAAKRWALGEQFIYQCIRSGRLPARVSIEGRKRFFVRLEDMIVLHHSVTRDVEPTTQAQEEQP